MTYIGNTSPSRFSSVPAVQRFSGNNSTTAFTLSTAIGSEQEILVSVDGVIQDTANYTVSGTTLTFSPAPSAGTNNIFVFTLSRAIASVTHPPTSALSATSGTFSGNVSVGGDLDVTGSLDMSDANLTNVGSISLDSISGDADANTNITFSGSDVITFTTGGSTAFTANANQSVTFNGNITAEGGDYLLRNSSGSSILSIISGTSGSSILKLGDTADFDIGQIEYNHGSNFLAIKTNDSERMRINSSGNVGIGTSSPANNLHVMGSLTLEGSSGTDNAWTFYKNTDQTYLVGIRGSSNDALAFYDLTADVERMRIDTSGNVGIGTTSPSSYYSTELVISTSDNGGITLANTNTSHASYIMFADGTSGSDRFRGQFGYDHNINAMVFHTDVTERMRILSGGEVAIGGTGYSGQPFSLQTSSVNLGYMQTTSTTRGVMNFRDGNSTNNVGFGCVGNNHVFMKDSTELMRIASDGNVAIGGTPDSAFRLCVNGDGSSEIGAIQFRNASSGGNTFTAGMLSATSSSALLNVVGAANLVIKTNNTERMRIDSLGRVGIGTTSPDSKLHVLGRFHSSSNNATTHPGSNDNTEHYISDYAKIGGKSLIGFSVAFPNGTSNLAIRLYALQNSLWISGDVIIGGTYSNGNASGFRRYSFTHNFNGSTSYNTSLTNTENRGNTNGHFELASHGWDSSEGVGAHYWEFRHLASSGNAMYVQFETMGSGVAYSPNWYWRHTTY